MQTTWDGKIKSEDHERGAELVRKDVEARLAAMTVHGMSAFGSEAWPVLDVWKRRCPDVSLLQPLTKGH